MTFRALNSQLQAQLANMTTIATSRQLFHTPAVHLESPGPSSRHGPHGLNETDNTDKLVIPRAPEELDPDDYPSACFWTYASWNNYKKNQINQGINPVSLGFLCNEEGTRVSKDCLLAMTKHAKQLWTSCYHLRMDPPTWTKKCDDTALFFHKICAFLLLNSDFARMIGKQKPLLLYGTQIGLPMYKAPGLSHISLSSILLFQLYMSLAGK